MIKKSVSEHAPVAPLDRYNRAVRREFDSTSVRPEDVLSSEEQQLLTRARNQELTCPHCTGVLDGRVYFVVVDGHQLKGVRLTCSHCGFDEI
jgi:hypothetical protein